MLCVRGSLAVVRWRWRDVGDGGRPGQQCVPCLREEMSSDPPPGGRVDCWSWLMWTWSYGNRLPPSGVLGTWYSVYRYQLPIRAAAMTRFE